MNPSIFRAYDIRGVYPNELPSELGISIGRQFIALLVKKYSLKAEELKIVIGYDVRRGSLPLAEVLKRSLAETGASVTDVGLVSTDMIYFAVGALGYDAGIMATASHNPKEYAGIKFVGRGVEGIDGENGLWEMRDNIINDELRITNYELGITDPKIKKRDILPQFVEHVLSFIDANKIKPLTVVVDAGNGSAAKTWPAIARKLSIKTIPLFFEFDGDFPGRGPNPGSEEALAALTAEVKKQGALCGFAFDGDADRVFVVDESGAYVNGSIMIALIAEGILKRKPDAAILYNVTGGRIIQETVNKYPRARAIITPVGHSKIKRMAKERKADFAGEPQSGHYFFKENFYADSAVIFALKLIELLSTAGKPLSALAAPYKKYYWSGELNFKLESRERLEESIRRLKDFYGDKGDLIEIDGIRFDFKNWWFGARPSNTEPLLRVNVEADSPELLEEKKREALDIASRVVTI